MIVAGGGVPLVHVRETAGMILRRGGFNERWLPRRSHLPVGDIVPISHCHRGAADFGSQNDGKGTSDDRSLHLPFDPSDPELSVGR